MNIIQKVIHIIDYSSGKTFYRETPESFEEYVEELIEHIENNESVRDYKTRANTTQVVSTAIQILGSHDPNFINIKFQEIADRLLRVEEETQERVRRMNINVKKGSLIQALLFDDKQDTYFYLLAKVEHSDFIDDSDFSLKTGFSKDKKTIWKSCLLNLYNVKEATEFDVKVYSDTKAKFWSDSFLELDEITTDEKNTANCFKCIDSVLNRTLKKESPKDYTYIRNAFIAYFRSHEHIDYPKMVEEITGSYEPFSLRSVTMEKFRERLKSLPPDKHFDYQFNSIPSEITARIRKTYCLNDGVELRLTHDVPDIKNTIKAFQDTDGKQYITIQTTNEEAFKSFQ